MALRFNYFDKKVHELEEGDELLRHLPVCEVCHKEFDDLKEQKLFESRLLIMKPIKRGTRTEASIQGYFLGLLRPILWY